MRICLVTSAVPRRWHHRLAQALASLEAARVLVHVVEAQASLPTAIPSLLALEKLVYRASSACDIDPLAVADGALGQLERAAARDTFDVVIVLDGLASDIPRGSLVLAPLFHGESLEDGIFRAVLDDQDVCVGAREQAHAEQRSSSYAMGFERPAIFTKVCNDACRRAIDLLVLRAAGQPLPAARMMPIASERHGPSRSTQLLAHASGAFLQRLQQRLTSIASGGGAWSIGWRRLEDGDGTQLLTSGTYRYQRLPSDTGRYYADPFPLQRDGKSYVFCEEFPYGTSRGLISLIKLENGRATSAQPIIEEAHHLSYPMIFEDDGQLWMIPESGESNALSLYRCTRFPDVWIRVTDLISDVKAYDATILHNQDGYWLFFTTAQWDGPTCDRLCIYHATALEGPWMAFGGQPAAFDVTSARPAGHFLHANRRCFQPTQDCSRLYGGHIVLKDVHVSRRNGYCAQTVGTIKPANARDGRGTHTLNRFGDIETVDVFGSSRNESFALHWHLDAEPAAVNRR